MVNSTFIIHKSINRLKVYDNWAILLNFFHYCSFRRLPISSTNIPIVFGLILGIKFKQTCYLVNFRYGFYPIIVAGSINTSIGFIFFGD